MTRRVVRWKKGRSTDSKPVLRFPMVSCFRSQLKLKAVVRSSIHGLIKFTEEIELRRTF